MLKAINIYSIIVLILLITQTALSQNDNYHGGGSDGYDLTVTDNISTLDGELFYVGKYHGGENDGYNSVSTFFTSLAGEVIEVSKYRGGNFDGYDLMDGVLTRLDGVSLLVSKYHGGIHDGYNVTTGTMTNLNGIIIMGTKYRGGDSDGYNGLTTDPIYLDGFIPFAYSKYKGGISDGYVLITSTLSELGGAALNLAKYYGGLFDGYSSISSLNDFSLPVTLTMFALKEIPKQTMVKVTWRTESEINNAFWLLYRKTAGDSMKSIQEFEGKGNFSNASEYHFIDNDVEVGNEYTYQLADISYSGQITYHEKKSIRVSIPEAFELFQNYPNPFNPQTTISYALPVPAKVQLSVFNILGQHVSELLNEFNKAGYHQTVWDGTNQSGNPVSSGTYIYFLKAQGKVAKNKNYQKAQRMILIR